MYNFSIFNADVYSANNVTVSQIMNLKAINGHI